MWGALSRLFVKSENPSLAEEAAEDCSGNFGDVDEQQQLQEIMEKQAIATATLKHQDMDTLESKQARQRASVKWILSKSFNNRVPENLKEPFYRDHEGQEHLKPQIVVGFGNATLYCQTLSNLYSDPNYQSLNHWSILQTLTRKGVPVGETADVPLTETVLIQTNPLRINAHMCVIEALMILYAKEVATSDRISSAIGRISGGVLPKDTVHHESALLYWISHACAALKKRINQEIESGAIDENGVRLQTPDIPSIRDYRDLCDGVCLAFLISYYCPKVVPWTSVRVNYLPTVEDSIFNVLLVNNFSQKHLPYSVFHMTPQDITYMRGSMKQNLVVLLADFFNLFEIHPAKCVCYPGMEQQETDTDNSGSNEHGIAHRRGLTCQPVTPIPDLRSGVDSPSSSSCSPNNTRPPFQVTRSASASTMRKPTPPRDVPAEQQQQQQQQMGTDEGFVVHRGRAITTLASLHHHQQQQQQQQQEPLVPARLRQAKEKSNNDSKAEERGDNMAAGRPSNWEDTRRPSYAGRRSRRNSFSEDSQLTIENFGGSQDQLNQIGRTMERERKFSNSTINNVIEQAVAVRSSIADARGTLQLGYDNDSGSEKQDRETEKTTLRRQTSMDNVSLRNIITHSKEKDTTDGDITQSHRNLSIHNNASTSSVIATAAATIATEEDTSKRKTSFASTLPNTTTWQQQSANFQQLDNDVDDERPLVDATKLTTIRMKLEEKRRHIEQEKRKMEFALSKQQQKVGKAAFLQAINKGKTHNQTDLSEKKETTISSHDVVDRNPPERPCSLQDLADINNIESKWDSQIESKKTPEIDHMDIDQYQQSIAIMNCSLKDIQQDIHRLTNQQSQMQAQHIQAQQLLQAQQIANMINQQQYGSQQHIPGQYRNTQQQPQLPHNFGSTPHLTQQQQHLYNSQPQRPPSRDPHQQQPLQYINDQGQYMTTPQPLGNNIQSNSREHSPYLSENGGQYQQYGGNDSPYNQHQYSDSNQYQTYRAEQQQYRDEYESSSPKSNQFYLHDTPPQPPARRTWAQTAVNSQPQQQQQSPLDLNAWSQNSPRVDTRTWKSPQSPALNQSGGGNGGGGGGFMLHQNGNNDYDKPDKSYPNLFPVHESPQHTRVHRQISQLMSSGGNQSNELQKQHADNHRVPMTPAIDDMAPQSISFIGDEDSVEHPPPPQISGGDRYLQQLHQPQHYPTAAGNGGAPTLKQHPQQNSSAAAHYDQQELDLGKLNITSGKLTYRIPSPTRPSLNLNSFQDPNEDSVNNEQKGFYIAFDNAQPKRPKPPLRTKRSPKKERSIDDITSSSNNHNSKQEQIYQLEKELDKERQNILHDSQQPQQHKANKLNSNNSSSNLFSDHRGGAGDDYNNSPFSNNKNYNRSGSGGGGGGIDEPIIRRHVSDNQMASILDRRHLEDVTNYPQSTNNSSSNDHHRPRDNKTLIIDDELTNIDPDSVDEMERKKEKIMLLSLQRRQQQEETKARKEIDAMQRREKEREKEEERIRKREEQVARRAAILEQHKFKKAIEEAEQKGLTIDRNDMLMMKQQLAPSASAAKLRTNKVVRPRPKTIHVETGSVDLSEVSSLGSRNKKGSNSNLTGIGHLSSNSMRRDYYRGSQDSLAIRESPDEYPSTSSTPIGRRGSYKNTTREPTGERGRTMSRISVAKGSNLNFRGRKSNSLMNLCDTDSGLGRATPPRRAPSPGMGPSGRHLPSPSGPGSLPPGFMNKRRIFDDGSSDISSAASSMMEYSGPKLYKQPATKSNRGIILNAVEYCVFPGVVNRDAKQKVLEKIARSEAKHFLVLFRDAGCQFRALYSYWPENETVLKLFGTGPSQVDEFMFDKFFKYNSGGKCFSQVHTKHLTVTIDAFTIHNSLWQGKKVAMPSKKDMALVI